MRYSPRIMESTTWKLEGRDPVSRGPVARALVLALALGPAACEQAGADLAVERESLALDTAGGAPASSIGAEIAVPRHLADGEELGMMIEELIAHGELLFRADWTIQEGRGRPYANGNGMSLADPSSPLVFPRNFNRVSAPDANACEACHSKPFVGAAGSFVNSAFVLAQRFDHVTFDREDDTPRRGAVDERGVPVRLDTVGNSRIPPSLFGAGYIEMLARQITADLQAIRDTVAPGASSALSSKGISFGTLSRHADGTWDTSAVEGLSAPSLASSGPGDPPSLIIRPFHQAGAVVSLREFANGAFNQHLGIQSAERFGVGVDHDGDGFVNEITSGDITAVVVFKATLPVPGRVIPRDREIEDAVLAGEASFAAVGCTDCHVPALPLDDHGWVFTEPNPYNPPGNLQPGDAPTLEVDLGSKKLPGPRLAPDRDGVVWVPAFTDLKLHDITSGPGDPNVEPLDMLHPEGSPAFFAGNSRFLTRKLWGVANEPPFFHHGKYSTLREAVLAHAGEAQHATDAYLALSGYQQDAVIEFLKTLQMLPPGTRHRIVDERGHKRRWPPRGRPRG